MHVTGPDFLDAATFPLMSFRSGGILHAGHDHFRMAGYLLLKDIELPVHVDLGFGGQPAGRSPSEPCRLHGHGHLAAFRLGAWRQQGPGHGLEF